MHRTAVSEPAPAKVNLALHVTGRRPDGYHKIESLAVFTAFGDRVTVCEAAADRFAVDGPYASDVPLGGDNLVIRARDAVRGAADPPTGSAVSIRLTKTLPVASGIGGGSSDAAAALIALDRFWTTGLAPDRLAALAARLGADVPMCLVRQPLVASGVGDVIAPVENFPGLPMVLVNPGVAVSTPAVFRALASRGNPPLPPLPTTLDFAALTAWLASTRNDLETPATMLAPAIADTLAALRNRGAAFARMSGSGATCFGLYATSAAAKSAARAIAGAKPGWFVIATSGMPSPARPLSPEVAIP